MFRIGKWISWLPGAAGREPQGMSANGYEVLCGVVKMFWN